MHVEMYFCHVFLLFLVKGLSSEALSIVHVLLELVQSMSSYMLQ